MGAKNEEKKACGTQLICYYTYYVPINKILPFVQKKKVNTKK